MKRVAFLLYGTPEDWLGGVSYLRNLLTAINSNHDRQIEPVLFVEPSIDGKFLGDFPSLEIVRSSLASSKHPSRLASRLAYSIVKRDLMLEAVMKNYKIDALSHSSIIGRRSEIASIGWIPDFQHIRMPHYFSTDEIRKRDRRFRRMIDGCQRIVLSSYDAKRDFEDFAPTAINKARVLQFVSSVSNRSSGVSHTQICDRFNIDRPYFHLPNQFWTHKNHTLVIDALNILKRRGFNVLVIATGKTFDYRDPSNVAKLVAKAKHLGVYEHFRILGVVSLDELNSLMLNAIALINPSNFEGWSTSVEEAKSLGLRMLLSDIPVHIEQAPPMGSYFKSNAAEDLADKMISALDEYDPRSVIQARERAIAELPKRIKSFGKAYESIAMDAIRDVCG